MRWHTNQKRVPDTRPQSATDTNADTDNENPEQNETGTDSSEKDWSAMEYKELQEAAKAKGINPAQKKAALIEELEKAE